MSTIKFTVEDSKAAGILRVVLNSGITVNDIEVTGGQRLRTEENSASYIIQFQPSSAVNHDRSKSTPTIIPVDAEFVGGTIFYIDDTADGVYEFLDVHGKVIENIQVGDRPYYYRVIKKGPKDKFYVYHDDIYKDLRWTWAYYGGKGYAYESLSTSKNTGSGKINTRIAVTKGCGIYVTPDSNKLPTIWYRLQQVRSDKGTGCDDWFVPSIDELELLRLAIKSGSVTGGIIAGSSYNNSVFNNRWIWSSSEFLSQRAWYWHYANQCWDGGNKGLDFSVIFIRTF